MMRVDFYQLERDPVTEVLPPLARKTLDAGQRLLVVCEDRELRAAIDAALWQRDPAAFLAHGDAGGEHAERQPILLSKNCEAANGAKFVALADGTWRDEALNFDRALLFFDGSSIDNARGAWRKLGERDDVTRHFWRQEGRSWREGP